MQERDHRSELESTRDKKWLDTRLKSLTKLPKARRTELEPLIKKSVRDYTDDHKSQRRIELALKFFDELNDTQRVSLWQGLFPGLSPQLERAWSRAHERTYLRGFGRSPFRAPGREPLARAVRADFFLMTCETLQGYDPTPEWLAAWAPHIDVTHRDPKVIGWILGSILRDAGRDAETVRGVLVDSINAEHPIGRMSHHAVTALLNSDERSDWEIIEKLLLAAQRQEGLRQSILEAVDEANPAAFRSMLGLILEHDLGRFSSVVRAFDLWLGYRWAGGNARDVYEGIQRLCRFMDSDDSRLAAIASGEAEEAYLALWVTAYRDADEALLHAATMVNDPDPARRYAALMLTARAGLFPERIDIPATRLLSGEENDDRILTTICVLLTHVDYRRMKYKVSDELFDAVAALFERFPAKKKPLGNLIWPWDQIVRERRDAAEALSALASGNPGKLLPYAGALEGYACANVIYEIAGLDSFSVYVDRPQKTKRRQLSVEEHSFVISMTKDARQDVHTAAFQALEGLPVTPDETLLLTDNLHRASPSFRKGAIERLTRLPPPDRLEACRKLLGSKHPKQKAAALELLEPMLSDEQSAPHVLDLVRANEASLGEETELAATAARILGQRAAVYSFDDCFGLVQEGTRAKPIKPSTRDVFLETNAAEACLCSLAELFLEHSETEIELQRGDYDPDGSGTLTHISSYFPRPMRIARTSTQTTEELLRALPLRDVWTRWVEERERGLRDKDGMELVRAWLIQQYHDETLFKKLPKPFHARNNWSLQGAFRGLVTWLPLLAYRPDGLEYLVRRVEESIANRDPKRDDTKPDYPGDLGRSRTARELASTNEYLAHYPSLDAKSARALRGRLGALAMLAMDRDLPGCQHGPSIDLFGDAYAEGLLNEYDFGVLLLKNRTKDSKRLSDNRFGPIDQATTLKRRGALAEHPALAAMADRVRDRLVEIELTRGEQATLATGPASDIRHAGGADTLCRLVAAMGRDTFVRQHQWGEPTRAHSFSRLIGATVPAHGDTDRRFAELIAEHALSRKRMVEVAMFAPQWSGHIERAFEAEGLEDAVWWIHAHTKRRDDWRRQDIRELWTAQIKERTELEAEDLEEGAVDVGWFLRLLERIGAGAWDDYQRPAKYASTSGGHKRAQLYADTMLGRVTADSLMPMIEGKRNQDAVRALGLVPLPKKATQARAETLRRYTTLQEFKRQSRTFGSQRQASEGRSVEIAMQNLARTAGYRDPQRLQWAMEAEAVADLAKGPVTVSAGETTVSLSISDSGEPELAVLKNAKPLKNVPKQLQSNEAITELRSRVTELRRQRSRMRLSLEEAMCRGDVFTGEELADLLAHPMLRPMMQRSVLIHAENPRSSLIGYPDASAPVLRSFDATTEAIGKGDLLRLAHPSDFLARGDWHHWQQECFAAERVQPFKQIFRELYPRTKAESGKHEISRRYAGHQVNPRQALALLKRRQWVFAPEEGVRRVIHDEGLVAELSFQEHFYTPADVDGLTLESVGFRRKGSDRAPVSLELVPDRVFSEVMRDLDLVVSVAHAGGVDPEASASTVEMRASLLRETCRLLALGNVRVEGQHALIDGTRASYSVHLGSASTRVHPGKMLVIVAIHSQYRGRLFLPFADDDPRTAEVMAKALLLARDHEIKDPSILDQIH